MKRTRFAAAIVAICALAVAAAPAAAAEPNLVGHWTFDDASGGETTGNWSSFETRGSSSVSNGQLAVNTSGGYAVAGAYSGPTIVDKTLISWVKLDGPAQGSGAALSISNPAENFDAIVYGERQPNRWMAGSDFFRRTQDFFPGAVDTDYSNIRQLVISYRGVPGGQLITGCLNGTQLGQYFVNNTQVFGGSSTIALFGPRHFAGSTPIGGLNAHIDEAKIYDRAMTCAETFDTDGDGVLDAADNCPNVANADQADRDGDGLGDVCDSDRDGDGVDNDADAFPDDPSESSDSDGDGVGDNSDNCPSDANRGQADQDGDGQGDVCDSDRDGDGVDNDADAFPDDPSESVDTDGDGIGNNADPDDDGDGVPDVEDSDPLDPANARPSDKDACKKDGWKRFVVDGKRFKNQGDCVSFVATKGKNGPAGS